MAFSRSLSCLIAMEKWDYIRGFFFTLPYRAHFLSLMYFVSIIGLDVSVLIPRFQIPYFHVLEGSYHTIFSPVSLCPAQKNTLC